MLKRDHVAALPHHDHRHALAGLCNDPSKHRSSKASTSINLAAAFTCLQFIFAMYVTFLLFFFIGPRIDIAAKLDSAPTTSSLELHKHYLKAILFKSAGSSQPSLVMAPPLQTKQDLCIHEEISFLPNVSRPTAMLSIKKNLYIEVLRFQQRARSCETLQELLNLPSKVASTSTPPKITIILNHHKRETPICAQIQALQAQTFPFHRLWVLSFNSSITASLQAMVEALHDARISLVGSDYNFRHYFAFQLALQAVHDTDYVYILDDDMMLGRKMLEIFAHAAGTSKYSNAVLGSTGHILPFKQRDYSFPSYHKYDIREAGLYLPERMYGIDAVEHVLQVDLLKGSWFLPASLVKAMFIETPFTFTTGEDLHLSYQLQKYEGAGSFVIPVDLKDKDTWGVTNHHVSQNTSIPKDIIQLRDKQWWQAMSKGFFTQWAVMNPQHCDAFFFAHSMDEVVHLAPLIQRFRETPSKKAYVVVAGGNQCPCEDAALQLGWSTNSCYDRRFKIFDLGLNGDGASRHDSVTSMRYIVASVKGLIKIHSPVVLVTVADALPTIVRDALLQAVNDHETIFIQLPKSSIPQCLWMADLKPYALKQWDKIKISISIITEDRPVLLQRLLRSVSRAMYVGDGINLSIHMDSRVTTETLKVVSQFQWPHGDKQIRRRVIQAGQTRAVSESWYPSSDNEFGLLLEDNVEVSPFYYMWVKYCLLTYHYSQQRPLLPELASIALHTSRLAEAMKERPRWNATQHQWHPNTPYLHQMPCGWGALFFPQHWKEFYWYMASLQHTADDGATPLKSVQIPELRTNGWQGSWKKYLIELMYLRGYVTLYPNFPDQASFSTNHMEQDTHGIHAPGNSAKHKIEDSEVPLMQDNFLALLPEQKLPAISKLPVINLFNQTTTIQRLKRAGSRLT